MKLLINFSDFDQIALGSVNNKTILTLGKQDSLTYIQIPSCLTYFVGPTVLEISVDSSSQQNFSIFNLFKKTVAEIKTNASILLKKKILLKGLGFRSTVDTTANTITFKLGYSHLNTLEVPEYIKNVKIKKNTILLEGSDKVLLGDYMSKIHQLKESDIYKGKGFSYKYTTKKLKIIKKK